MVLASKEEVAKGKARMSIGDLDDFQECYDNYQPWHHLQIAANIQLYYIREEEEKKMQPAVVAKKEVPSGEGEK